MGINDFRRLFVGERFRFLLSLAAFFVCSLTGVYQEVRAAAQSAPSPAPQVLTPLQQQLIIEKGRLDKMRRLAYAANPALKEAEELSYALKRQMEKKQQESREAIDRYLKENKLDQKDLAAFELDRITDLMMRIMPYKVVSNPKLKAVVTQAIKRGKPVFPGDFARQFPGKKPGEIPEDQLLAFYTSHLKTEAEAALAKLGPLAKEAKTPAFMLDSMQDITYVRCVLTIYRTYLDGWEPAELKAQYRKVSLLEAQLHGGGQ